MQSFSSSGQGPSSSSSYPFSTPLGPLSPYSGTTSTVSWLLLCLSFDGRMIVEEKLSSQPINPLPYHLPSHFFFIFSYPIVPEFQFFSLQFTHTHTLSLLPIEHWPLPTRSDGWSWHWVWAHLPSPTLLLSGPLLLHPDLWWTTAPAAALSYGRGWL